MRPLYSACNACVHVNLAYSASWPHCVHAEVCNACIRVKLAYSTLWPNYVHARSLQCRPEATVHKLLLGCGSEEVLQKGFSCHSSLRLLAVYILVHDSYWKLNLQAACLPADHVARSVHVTDLLN